MLRQVEDQITQCKLFFVTLKASGLLPPEVTEFIKFLSDLEKLPELDQMTDYLSPGYIRSIRDQAKSLVTQAKDDVLNELTENDKVLFLQKEVKALHETLVELQETMKIVDPIRKFLQDGIQKATGDFLNQEDEKNNVMSSETKKIKRAWSSLLPSSKKEQKRAEQKQWN